MDWLKNPLVLKILGGLIRHGLTVAAGLLVAKGYATDDQASQVVGALVVLGSVAWSIFNKTDAHAVINTQADQIVAQDDHITALAGTVNTQAKALAARPAGASINDPDPS